MCLKFLSNYLFINPRFINGVVTGIYVVVLFINNPHKKLSTTTPPDQLAPLPAFPVIPRSLNTTRHGYAHRAHLICELLPKVAAAAMGHSLETYLASYSKWCGDDVVDTAFQQAASRLDRISKMSNEQI